jgi:uncharacterized protein (TIGR02444 family)
MPVNNPLWEYSLAHYAREGVSEACLALQDSCDLDVNLLLYGAWLASMNQRLNPEHLSGLEHSIARWRQEVVRPLRALRRQWRDYEPARELRRQLGELELEAERMQQDQMLAYYRAAPALAAVGADLRGNLLLVAECCGTDAPGKGPRIARLAGLLRA